MDASNQSTDQQKSPTAYPVFQQTVPQGQQSYPPAAALEASPQPGQMTQGQLQYAPPPSSYQHPSPVGYQQVQPGGYYPPTSAQQGFGVVTTQPLGTVGVSYKETPVRVTCNSCHAEVTTSVSYEVGLLTWLACLGICAVGLFLPCVWLGCCFIPFCVQACKDAIHRCPNCQAEVGRYKKM